ncbi:MAG: hypothetical protein IJH43_06920 [Mogibacterium sp.]|nr:hypothetical protein [Mogibacterium sp.]
MSKKTIAIIIELIPIIAAVIALIILYGPVTLPGNAAITVVSFLLAILGFVFFFIGRKLAKDDKTVRVLGVLDCLATLSIIGVYVVAVLVFGL